MEAAKKLRGVIRGDENVEFDKFVEGGCYNFCRKKDLSIFCLNCRFNMLSAVPVCCLLSAVPVCCLLSAVPVCCLLSLSAVCCPCLLSAVPVCCLLSLSAVYKKRKGKLPPFFRLVN